MSSMTRQQAINALKEGVHADCAASAAILALLERQFDCALRHRSAELTALAAWAELEQTVVACKRATTRNTALLTEQFSVMQRVLHGEEHTYAPR